MIERIRIVVFGLTMTLVAACAVVWQKPEVRLVDVSVLGGNFVQENLQFSLRVMNRNSFDMTLESLDFELVVGEKALAQGRLAESGTVSANEDKVFKVVARVQLLKMLRYLPQWIQSDGMLHYRLRGHGRIRGYGEITFDHPGTLDPARLH